MLKYIKKGESQILRPPVAARTAPQTNCSSKQEVINKIVLAVSETKNKAVLKTVAAISLLGVVNNIAPAPEYAGQPICMRVASALNQLRAIRNQFKAIDTILTENNL